MERFPYVVNSGTGQQEALYSPGKLLTSENATNFILPWTPQWKTHCLVHAQLNIGAIGDIGKQWSSHLLLGTINCVIFLEILKSTSPAFISSPLQPMHVLYRKAAGFYWFPFWQTLAFVSGVLYFIRTVQSKRYYSTENSLALKGHEKLW